MTHQTSPDWLPSGWPVQSRLQKNGRKITHYVNLDTAQKFFSKDDLILHEQMGNPQCNDPQPTSSSQICPPDEGHAQTAVRANEHPEWLPDGWLVELKTRKSGASAGKREKSYFDPSTGFRFYSKPEVLRYLNNVKQKGAIYNQKKCSHFTSKVVTENHPADDLPPGWINELKVRECACGKKMKKDPYYTGPASGYVCHSKKDVFHYLKTGETSKHAFLPKKRKIMDQKYTNDETTPLPAAERHSHENGTVNVNSAKANNSGNSRKNKESELPCRSSRRLAGLEPELAAHEVALQTTTTKHCKIKANTVKVLVEEATQHLRIGYRMVSTYQATVDLTTQSHGERARESRMLPCEKPVLGLGEKPQMMETKKIHVDTSAVQPLLSSDPCLKNATKNTLTGAMPIKKVAENGIVCAIPANIQWEKNLGETTTSAVQPLFSLDPCLKNVAKNTLTGAVPVKKVVDNGIVCAIPANILREKSLSETSMGSSPSKETSIKKKKEFNLPRRSSKKVSGLAPELVGNSLSSEQDFGLATRDSCNKEATRDVGLESENLANGAGAYQLIEAGPIPGRRHECLNTTSVLWEDSSNKSKDPLQNQTFPADKCQKQPVTEKIFHENSKLQFSFPFAGSWSDPCLEFAIKTLTGAIPLEDAVNFRLVSAPAANILQENNIGETIVQSSSSAKTALNSSKSKKMKNNKELNLPRRSSKRLAGLTPEQVVDTFSRKQGLATAARNYCNKEAISGLTSEILASGSCQQHDLGPITGLRHDCTYAAPALHGEISPKSKDPFQDQTVYPDQCPKLDNVKMPSEKSEPQIRFPFVDSWPDPCLDFAIKTLTGAIPLEDAAIDGLVSAPATSILQEMNFGEAIHGSSRRVKTLLNSNKSKTEKRKELNLPPRSSKRLSRPGTQLVMNSLSTEQTFTVVGRNSCDEEAISKAGSISEKLVDGACRQLGTEPIIWHKEKGKEPLQCQTVSMDHCQRPDSEKIYDEKLKPQFLFPFGDSWSDPCLEFTSKTFRGAIAVEDNFIAQDYFQQQLDTSSTKRDGGFALPDFGLPNFFQTDISSHFNSPEKTPLWQQQFTVNPSGLPPADASLPSGSGIGYQQPSMGGVRNYPAK